MDLKEIMNAWITSLNPSSEQTILAEKRMEICGMCPSLKKVFNQQWMAFCGECGCPINKKVYTTENNPCPLLKWSEVDGEMYLPKKEKTLI